MLKQRYLLFSNFECSFVILIIFLLRRLFFHRVADTSTEVRIQRFSAEKFLWNGFARIDLQRFTEMVELSKLLFQAVH